jgi:micrococcal nuclease
MLRFCLLVIAGSLFFASPALAQTSQIVTVERVVDGDTIEVSPAVSGTKDVRLLGVDTPETVDPNEPVEPYGPQASAFTKRQLEGLLVTLIFDRERTDQYGRALAYVRLGNQSKTFNETLLRRGYAQLYVVPPNDRYEAAFGQAQDQARQAQRGIWSLPKEQQCELADRGNGIGEGSAGCQGQPPEQPPEFPADSGADKDCSDYPSQSAAQAVLRQAPEDPYGLDGPVGRSSTGIPGVACESKPAPTDFRPVPGYGDGGGGDDENGGGRRTPGEDQYTPKGPVDRPEGVIPRTPLGRIPPTGGPPVVLGALALLGTAVIVGRGVLKR